VNLGYTGFSIDDAMEQETTTFLRGIHPEDIERLREERRKAMLMVAGLGRPTSVRRQLFLWMDDNYFSVPR
jgi:hypothetical protein